jgi:glycogen debranching enzyme
MQMPGAISEMSPDYGCFVQAWSGYGVAWPVVTGIFGIRPDAYHHRVTSVPNFPADWSQARLTNVRIGTNSLDLRWDGTTVWVSSQEPGWVITCDRVPIRVE